VTFLANFYALFPELQAVDVRKLAETCPFAVTRSADVHRGRIVCRPIYPLYRQRHAPDQAR
jgi:hypothetical protein